MPDTPTVLMLLHFVPDQDRTLEQFLLGSVRQLREQGWRTIFVFAGEPCDAFAELLRAVDAMYFVSEFPLDEQGANKLIASLKGYSPCIMTTSFMSFFSPVVLQIKRQLGIRYWLVHDHTGGEASRKSGLKRLLAMARGWYFGRQMSSVVAVSEYIARRDIEDLHLPRTLVKVVHNAVDLERYHPSPDPVQDLPDDPLIVYVGRLLPEKGIRTLLRALVLLKQRPVPLAPRLELAGEGSEEEEALKAFTREHGLDRLKFLGQVSDVGALYRAATVVVVPSEIAESFGLVIAEAMACGACVLASDAGGIPEVIGPDEEGGRIFKRGDAADLAEKLAALLEDGAARERYRKQGRARAERLFGLDRMVSGFVNEVLDLPKQK